MLDGTDEDETHLTVRAGRGDEIHQLEHFATELRWAMVEAIAGGIWIQDGVVLAVGEFIQTCGHTIAEDGDGRFHDRQLHLKTVDALGDGIETRTRSAEWAVAAVAEITDGEVTPGEFAAHLRLEVTEVIFALDEHVADEQHAVTVLEGELGLGEGGEGAGQEAGQREERAQGRTHKNGGVGTGIGLNPPDIRLKCPSGVPIIHPPISVLKPASRRTRATSHGKPAGHPYRALPGGWGRSGTSGGRMALGAAP